MLRIAMCDDETEAREALYLLLDQELHEESEQIVYEFSTGTAAANWLQKHPGEIDVYKRQVLQRRLRNGD